MTLNAWVRLRGSDSPARGQIIAISSDGEHVWVRWPRGVKMHSPDELEVCDDRP